MVFPQDLLQNGFAANNFAMLGLGDIVIPGIFIALLLRFDHSLKRQTKTYFHAACLAYFLGLMATIFVMHVFKHAQPALLYLVPACVGTPLLLALVKGDLTALFKWVRIGQLWGNNKILSAGMKTLPRIRLKKRKKTKSRINQKPKKLNKFLLKNCLRTIIIKKKCFLWNPLIELYLL